MSELTNANTRLDFYGKYTCPVCRHGEISAIPLMEAFSCHFCRHIFTANLEQQTIKMADSQLPLTWRWNGRTWTGGYREENELGWGYWIAGTAFVLLPTSIVGLFTYIFPPLPDSSLSWFPLFWVGLTFFAHLAFLGWLVLEYYQLPISLYIRAIGERLFVRF
jgi:hypothetical protein